MDWKGGSATAVSARAFNGALTGFLLAGSFAMFTRVDDLVIRAASSHALASRELWFKQVRASASEGLMGARLVGTLHCIPKQLHVFGEVHRNVLKLGVRWSRLPLRGPVQAGTRRRTQQGSSWIPQQISSTLQGLPGLRQRSSGSKCLTLVFARG